MHKFIVITLAIITTGAVAHGCDVCGCYTPRTDAFPQSTPTNVAALPTATALSLDRVWATGLYGAVAEQFTYFGTVQENGNEVANPTGQYLASSNTQLVGGYTFNPRFALQLNLPFIYREFARPEGFEIDRGTVSGLGDISLLAKFVAYQTISGSNRQSCPADSKSQSSVKAEPDFAFSLVMLAGIKFPTGDTSRLKEEFDEMEVPGAPESGIHGHDLTLGTGSYDGIFGGQTSIRYGNWFAQGDLQFALRGDGRHQYNFANDLSWSGGPGYYFVRRSDSVFGMQFVVSGEYKDVDQFQGEPAVDTGITTVFVGPRAVASFGRFSAEIEVDLPVLIDNTAFQAVPDYRIRGGIAMHF